MDDIKYKDLAGAVGAVIAQALRPESSEAAQSFDAQQQRFIQMGVLGGIANVIATLDLSVHDLFVAGGLPVELARMAQYTIDKAETIKQDERAPH